MSQPSALPLLHGARTSSPGKFNIEHQTSSTIKGEEEEEYHDPKITNAKRNVDMVHFGDWKIKTWFVVFQRLNSGQAVLTPTRPPNIPLRYYSPYPLTDEIPETVFDPQMA
ncbi:hypothetical protein FA13DRAFT_1807608 [Coprinellus micaceus]|uniref:Uncharacterized protein n=1 Tax=Coprinellus micaceus TaxID=71717 RepID=A0A4Y7R753_COPMI|nr:hypothetical protein FA13DRAFT_1807608 [Coprinellus micaceus]